MRRETIEAEEITGCPRCANQLRQPRRSRPTKKQVRKGKDRLITHLKQENARLTADNVRLREMLDKLSGSALEASDYALDQICQFCDTFADRPPALKDAQENYLMEYHKPLVETAVRAVDMVRGDDQ